MLLLSTRRSTLLISAALGLLGSACSSTESEAPSQPAGVSAASGSEAAGSPGSEASAEPGAGAEAASSADKADGEPGLRVLVTGFNDWRELGDPPQLWRCRDNPSCRLLVGDARQDRPERFEGPLVSRLRAGAPEVSWSFATMPVTWGAFAEVPRDDYDVIVNIGLGVYDRFDALQLESGAFNLRRGADAAGVEQPGPIHEGQGEVIEAPADSPIGDRLAKLAGAEIAGYEVLVAEAREGNSYLCNETHFSALKALREGREAGARLRAVYFLHIPYAKDGDYEALAEGVAGVVLRLVE